MLAVVKARDGSNGLPNKNLLPRYDHPSIAHPVTGALCAGRVTRTTDYEPLRHLGRSSGITASTKPRSAYSPNGGSNGCKRTLEWKDR
jgi:hypothetical protein